MKEKLEAIRAEARVRLEDCKTKADLEGLRVRFLGKKGELTALLRGMGCLLYTSCSAVASRAARLCR